MNVTVHQCHLVPDSYSVMSKFSCGEMRNILSLILLLLVVGEEEKLLHQASVLN